MEQASSPHYLRQDLVTLGVLVVVIAAAVAGLWYAEQTSGWFSQTAAALLDASAR